MCTFAMQRCNEKEKFMSEKIRIGISQGDSNGIGYEVIIKTLSDPRIQDFCIPVIYGSSRLFSYYRKMVAPSDNFSMNIIGITGEIKNKQINIVNCVPDEIRVEPGKSTPDAAQAALRSLQTAVNDLKTKKIDVLVTAPFNKETMQGGNFSFPGHTEYLAKAFGVQEPLMFLVSEILKVGVVTGHVPLSQVSSLITKESVLQKLQLMNRSLKSDFGIRRPRIAVLGLNPHAGDAGLLGKEEDLSISPAIAEANRLGILAFGPYPADGFFGASTFRRFDATLAMYHDQGLTPFKALSFCDGVNFTAGLPIVRTSPAHGVAYNIAGTGQASPDSMRAAIYAACDIFRNRKKDDQLRDGAMESINIENLPQN